MKHSAINEDIQPEKLYVLFSAKISDRIKAIKAFNRNNKNAISELNVYISVLEDYLSNRKIAFDDAQQFIHLSNGGMFVRVLGYDVGFIVIDDNRTNIPFVYVFKMQIKPEELGLNVPPSLLQFYSTKTKVLRLSESDVRHMVSECILRIISEQRKRVGKYTIVDGDCFTPKIADSIPQFGHWREVRMYFSDDCTYCLHQRCDNDTFFMVKIVPAPELGKNKTKYQPVSSKNIPQLIYRDVQSLILKLQNQHNVLS